jgi:cell division septation protein DedD
MNEKSNFYVFERKEIFLVILFVILIAITSFLFGLKIGSGYSFQNTGNTSSDLQQITTETKKVDFISTEEEKVQKLVKKEEATKREDINEKIEKSLKQKMIDEFSQENKKFAKPAVDMNAMEKMNKPMEEKQPMAKPQEEAKVEEPAAQAPQVEEKEDSFSGKYTIQLSSFQSLAEAKEFAEGFKVLGYNPIINEKNIPGRGNWFRVSIGVFNSLAETKNYILKNKSLFAERDYVLTKFD